MMEKERRSIVQNWIFVGALSVGLVATFWVVPNLSPGHDSIGYLNGARCYLEQGLECDYPREPFYPWFLALVLKLGLRVESVVPFFQNLLFVLALFYFAFEFSGRNWARSRWAALWTVLTPTFWIPMNGSIYAESIIATMILVLFSTLFGLLGSPEPVLRSKNVIRLPVLMGVAGALTLSKGSLLFIELLFCFSVFFISLAERLTPSLQPTRRRLWAALLLIGLSSLSTQWLWTHVWHSSESYQRGGVILYGRTEYAKRFDFRHDIPLYLLNAFSESACRYRYGTECRRVTFEAENEIGFQALAGGAMTDSELFARGKRDLIESFPLELLFVPFEWSKFVFYHGTSGFARLEVPILGGILHSAWFNGLLKILSLLTIVVGFKVLYFQLKAFRATAPKQGWKVILCLFGLAYLTVYGFSTTVVRMVYPISAFLTYNFWLAACERLRLGILTLDSK